MMLIDLGRGIRPLKTGAWSPNKLSGLIGWYDAADTGTITHASSFIGQVNDKSGAGNHLLGSGSNKPSTGTLTINGLNTINFEETGYNRFLSLDGTLTGPAPAGLSSQQSTVAFIFKQSTTASNGAPIAIKSTINSDAFVADLGTTNRGYFPQSTGANFMHLNPTVMPRGSVYCVVFVWSQADGIKCYVNGTLAGSDPAASTNYINRFILSYRPSTGLYWRGAIGEICVLNRAINNTERAALTTYLKRKWGIA